MDIFLSQWTQTKENLGAYHRWKKNEFMIKVNGDETADFLYINFKSTEFEHSIDVPPIARVYVWPLDGDNG